MTSVIEGQEQRAGRIAVARLTPGELPALLAMLGRCSSTTLFHRFHGITDGIVYARGLAVPDAHSAAFLAWNGGCCVGLANLAGTAAATHVGVLVEDRYQRMGVGRRLFAVLVAEARRRRIDELRAEVLGERAFVVRLLARAGAVRCGITSGVYSVRLDTHAARCGPR